MSGQPPPYSPPSHQGKGVNQPYPQYPQYPQYGQYPAQPAPYHTPPPQGYYVPAQPVFSNTVTVGTGYPAVSTSVGTTSSVTVVQSGVGTCPNCRVGYFRDEYGVGAILLAILFFPIGILCCLAMRERRCTHCGLYGGS